MGEDLGISALKTRTLKLIKNLLLIAFKLDDLKIPKGLGNDLIKFCIHLRSNISHFLDFFGKCFGNEQDLKCHKNSKDKCHLPARDKQQNI